MITGILALIHLLSFWFLWALNGYILYKKYSKMWLLKAFLLAFFCSLLGTLIAVFVCVDNSEGKPDRHMKDILKHIID